MKRTFFFFMMILSFLLIPTLHGLSLENWYAGQWDSTIYNRSEKPRTVAVRIEVIDTETGMPVPGTRIALKGEYIEERIGTPGDQVGIPYEPHVREFEFKAITGKDGVVVFALSWQKEYPWRSGAPESCSIHDSWIRAIDDIEKVKLIEIRHSKYRFVRKPFNFYHLLEFGQDKKSVSQEPHLFEAFESAWHREMRQRNVKFCVLDLGTEFPDFQNKQSTRLDFFAKIRNKDFGTMYTKPANWFSVGQHPQSECGPYFIYLIEIDLERRSGQLDVYINK